MTIKEQFDNIAEKYDAQRRQLIPCFDDYYNLPLSVLNFKGEMPNVLDIGGGTGLCSQFLLQKFPKAKITLIDLSESMLAVARERFRNYNDFQFIVDDYTTHHFSERFDIIISALSIHHLTAIEKEKLYAKCYNMLNDKGIFLNVDQALSPSQKIDTVFSNLMREFIEQSGLSKEEIAKAYERMSFDKPSSLADQILWLNNAGFAHVDCLYKYYHFCVFYAMK
jgi:tRNA (cmo5U34)-methyltransferase